MKLFTTFSFVLSLVLLVTLNLSSCKKKNDKAPDDISYVKEVFRYYRYTEDLSLIADLANAIDSGLTLNATGLDFSVASACAVVSKPTDKEIIIDFGNTNCICKDGRYRRGRIIVKHNIPYRRIWNSDTITTENYFVDDYKVDGKRVIYYDKIEPYLYVNTDVYQKITITDTMGKKVVFDDKARRYLVEGSMTPELSDDVYNLNSTPSIVRADGSVYTFSSGNIKYSNSCKYITATSKGKFTFSKIDTAKLTYPAYGDCNSTLLYVAPSKNQHIVTLD